MLGYSRAGCGLESLDFLCLLRVGTDKSGEGMEVTWRVRLLYMPGLLPAFVLLVDVTSSHSCTNATLQLYGLRIVHHEVVILHFLRLILTQ